MSVHYKFKSSTDYDTVTFDGLHISVGDLKKAILQQKKIGKSADFDLQITNAQTKEEYSADDDLVPKNTSVIVARVPVTNPVKKSWERSDANSLMQGNDSPSHVAYDKLAKTADLVNANATEEEKIKAMMTQSGQEYEPSKYMKNRNMTGPLPPNYVCYRCSKSGHWIKNCPTNSSTTQVEIKRSTGIPRSFMVTVEGPEIKGALLTSTGDFAVPLIDQQAYKEVKKEKPPFLKEAEVPMEPEPQLPEELLCMVCKDLLQDAVLIPCCGNSFCDECARQVLMDSEIHECPSCHEIDISPDNLIPNRYLRTAVMNFRNKTGYTRAKKMSFADPIHQSQKLPECSVAPAASPALPIVSVPRKGSPRPDAPLETKQETADTNIMPELSSGQLDSDTVPKHEELDVKLEVTTVDGNVEDPLGDHQVEKSGYSGEPRAATPLADEPPLEYKSRYDEDSSRRSHHHSRSSQELAGRGRSHDYYQDRPDSSEPSTISTITTRLNSWGSGRRQQSWNSKYSNQSYEDSSRRERDSRDYGSYRSSSTDYNRRGYNNRNYPISSGYRYSSRGSSSRGGSSRVYPRYASPPPALSRYVSPPPSHHRSAHSALPHQVPPPAIHPLPPEKQAAFHSEQTVFHTEPPPPGTDLHGQPSLSVPPTHRPSDPHHDDPHRANRHEEVHRDPRHEDPHREPLLRSPPPTQQHREPPPPGVGPLMPLPPPPVLPSVQTSHPPPPSTVAPPPIVTAPPLQSTSSVTIGSYPDNYSRHLEVYRQSNLYHDSRRNKDKKWSKDPMDDFARELMEFKREHRPLPPRRSRSRSYHSSKSWSHSRSRSYSRSLSRSRSRSRTPSYSSRSRSRTFSRSRTRSRSPVRSFTRSRSHSRGSMHSGSRSPRRKYRSPQRYYRSRSRTPPKHFRGSQKPFHKRPELPIVTSHPPPSTYYPPPSYIPSYNASIPPPNPPPIDQYNQDRGYYDHYHMGYDNFPPLHGGDNRRFNIGPPHQPPLEGRYPPPPIMPSHLDKYMDPRKFHPRSVDRRNVITRKDERISGSSRGGEGNSSYPATDKYKERTEMTVFSSVHRKEDKAKDDSASSSRSHKHSSRDTKKVPETSSSSSKRSRTKKEETPQEAAAPPTVVAKDNKAKKASKGDKHSKEHKHRHKKAKDSEEHKKKKKKPSSDETSQVTGSESEKPKKKKKKKVLTEKLKQITEAMEPLEEKHPVPMSPVKEIVESAKEEPAVKEPELPLKEEKVEVETSPVSEEHDEPQTPEPEEKSLEVEDEQAPSAANEELPLEGEVAQLGQELAEVNQEDASVHNDSSSNEDLPIESGEDPEVAEDPVLDVLLPERSKWERDDSEEGESDEEPSSPSSKKGDVEEPARTSISSDILQKAENAILGKAPKLQVIAEGQSGRVKPVVHSDKTPEQKVAETSEIKLQDKTESIARVSGSESPKKKDENHQSTRREPPERSVQLKTERSSAESRNIRLQGNRQDSKSKTQSRDWDRPGSRNSSGSRHSSGSRNRSDSRPRSLHNRPRERSDQRDKREVHLRLREKSRYGSHSRTIRLNESSSRKQGTESENPVVNPKSTSRQRKSSRDHAHDESSFEPNYDETSDSDASVTSGKNRSKVVKRRVSIKNEPLPAKHSRSGKPSTTDAASKSKHSDSDKHRSKSSSENTKEDKAIKRPRKSGDDSGSGGDVTSKKRPRVEEPSKDRKQKSESVSSSSSASESGTSEAEENPKKKSKSESPDREQKHRPKRSKHRKHRKHKHKHKKRKSTRREKDEIRVMSSVVRR